MKHFANNPRQITERQFSDLRRWLAEFGDLSGIVHDLNSDEIVGGNQRARVFDVNECDVILTSQLEEPDEQGTVALGYVVWHDKAYAYRQVRWTPEQCRQANIIANKAGGTWDFDMLANTFEVDELLTLGFEEFELVGFCGNGHDNTDVQSQARATLAERFVVPPFSVLDARQGYWQERKRAWLDLGIQSELGRGENALPGGSLQDAATLGDDGHTRRGDGRGHTLGGGQIDLEYRP